MMGGGLVVYNTKSGGDATGRWAGGLLPLESGEQTRSSRGEGSGRRAETEGDRVIRRLGVRPRASTQTSEMLLAMGSWLQAKAQNRCRRRIWGS